MTLDIDTLRSWIGRIDVQADTVSPGAARALAATLDRDPMEIDADTVADAAAHWLNYFPPARQSDIDIDGHPHRGSFLPPVPLPRRMWAGSQVDYLAPLRVGEPLLHVSRIEDVRLKEGRTGPLVFVKVRHEISGAAGLAVSELQDIVYRDMPTPGEAGAPASRTDEEVSRTIVPDSVLLFRYSALMFNGHRIHYDRPYAMEVEAYPGLVVPGPLVATLLLDLLRRHWPDRPLRRFAFRAVSPVFDSAPLELCARVGEDGEIVLWARDANGLLAMHAQARFV